MTPKEILEKIILEEGDCSWINHVTKNNSTVCEKCPFSKLKKRSNGEYLCCLDALGITVKEHNSKKTNLKYKKIAEQMLFQMLIEEILCR